MGEFRPESFQVDSSLELPADSWSADVPRTADWLAASTSDAVTLQAGFYFDDVPYLITLIKDGVIDEYGLNVSPRSVRCTMQGRDRMALLLERRFAKRYTANPPAETISGEPGGDVEEVYGRFRASEIAEEICESLGLKLSWECRDYWILTSFDAIGRPIDILKNLVEPWSQVEPLKVDVFLHGEVVICRGRQLNPTVDAILGTFPMSGARVTALQMRKFPLKLIGEVKVSGYTLPGVPGGEKVPQEPPVDPITGGPVVTVPAGTWAPNTNCLAGDTVNPTTPNGFAYTAHNAGQSGGSEPTWPTTPGATVDDNGITWGTGGQNSGPPGTPNTWTPNTPLDIGDTVVPTVDNGLEYTVTQPGTTGMSEPTWNTTLGQSTSDGSIIYGNAALNPANNPPPAGSMPFSPGMPGWSYGEQTVDETSVSRANNVTTVVHTATTYRTPDLVAKKVEKTTTTDGTVSSKSLKESSWDQPPIGPDGKPKSGSILKEEEETIWGWVEDATTGTRQFVATEHMVTTYSYDDLRFLINQTQVKAKRNNDTGRMDDAQEMETKTYKSEAQLWVKVTTEKFIMDPETHFWSKQSTDEQISSGHRPGGVNSGGAAGGLSISGYPPAPPASGASSDAAPIDPDPYRPPASGDLWVPPASAGAASGDTWPASAWPSSGDGAPWWPPEDYGASGWPPDYWTTPGPSGVDPGDGTTVTDNGTVLSISLVLSDDPTTEPFQYSNPNLSLDDLWYIVHQLEQCQGLWQVEIGFTALNMPWLRRASIVQFTDLEGPDGEAIPVPAGLLQSMQLSYKEGESMTRQGKALAWI